jgi:hypothetical protein
MAQHTPGPWKYDHSTWGGRRRISGNHCAIAEVIDSPEGLANARVIIAAPALFEFAKKALDDDLSLEDIKKLHAVIATVEGRS